MDFVGYKIGDFRGDASMNKLGMVKPKNELSYLFMEKQTNGKSEVAMKINTEEANVMSEDEQRTR